MAVEIKTNVTEKSFFMSFSMMPATMRGSFSFLRLSPVLWIEIDLFIRGYLFKRLLLHFDQFLSQTRGMARMLCHPSLAIIGN